MKDIRNEAENVRQDINRELDKANTSSSMTGNNKSGVTGAVTTVTGTVGAALGGVSRTIGGVVGATGRGVGDTVNNTTGTRVVGDGVKSLTEGVEGAAGCVAKGVEQGSQGRRVW
ncbi:hypothetical protein Tdes44962_MAKER05620 [Teratosphaeria destructans]|uniref:Uncharacterized protein n=1 Tax=Teratosphaeria destructans TaxID=418781 RepID=A0A9W7SJI7_9PEZI|nr:hypothetical protein Tdes44962_MAKER05620 [Teratosphaeria destructans]